ncbi:hypothetical protein F5Y06DRAFT_221915 [Hypoxylon sp. FL0890]|nr:hypothetical protein F5Y06DRAFT_221915 [Hypoxylon sp. FL0890]
MDWLLRFSSVLILKLVSLFYTMSTCEIVSPPLRLVTHSNIANLMTSCQTQYSRLSTFETVLYGQLTPPVMGLGLSVLIIPSRKTSFIRPRCRPELFVVCSFFRYIYFKG